jgi:hypothetical protein
VRPRHVGKVRAALAGLGAFLVVFGLLLRFYAAPRLVAAPAGLNLTITLMDPHASYFDQSALVTRRDVPITYVVTIRGDASASTASIAVWDVFTVLEDLQRNIQLIATYQRSAFDRHTGELTNCCGASLNDDTQVRQYGLGVVFWPIGTQKTTYLVYDTNTERAWPATYDGAQEVQGLLTYRFTQLIPATVVQNLPGVPTALLGIPGKSVNVVASRTYQASNTFWVDPRTGVPIDVEERIVSVLHGPGGRGSLMVAQGDLVMTPGSQRSLAALATRNAGQITIVKVTGPLGSLALGFLLILLSGTPLPRLLARRLLRQVPAILATMPVMGGPESVNAGLLARSAHLERTEPPAGPADASAGRARSTRTPRR